MEVRMKMEIRVIGTSVLAVGLLAGTVLAGGPDKGGKEGKARERCGKPELCKDKGGKDGSAERQEFQQAQQERMKAFMAEQRASWQGVMQSVKSEEDPYKVLALLRVQRVAQREKAVAFHEAQWDRQMQFTGAMLEKKGVEQEHREQVLKKMVAEHETRKTEADARYAKSLKALDDLAAKENLTKEEVRAALRGSMEGKRERKGADGVEQKRERKGADGVEQKRERKGADGVEQKRERKGKDGVEQKRERKGKDGVEEKPVIKAAPDA